MNNQFVLPVTDLYDGAKRRAIIQFVLDQPEDHWFPKQDIVDALGVSHDTLRQNIGPMDKRGEPSNGPLVQYGVLDVRDPSSNHPHYRRGDTNVVRALLSWQRNDGYPLDELLGSKARRKLTSFFLEQADAEETYTRQSLADDVGSNYSTVDNHVDMFVDAGVLSKSEEGKATHYQLNEDADTIEFLHTLNALLYETYQERSA